MPERTEASDEALMTQFQRGDRAAFDALYGRYATRVRRYLTRIVRVQATAEELTQTTFLSVVRARDRYISGMSFRAWLYAIATNAARDHLRRSKGERLTEPAAFPDAGEAPPEPRDAGLERAVHAALDELPASQRDAILLHRFEGLPFSEVAAALGVSETAAKVRAHRGYTRLRELLAPLHEEVS